MMTLQKVWTLGILTIGKTRSAWPISRQSFDHVILEPLVHVAMVVDVSPSVLGNVLRYFRFFGHVISLNV